MYQMCYDGLLHVLDGIDRQATLALNYDGGQWQDCVWTAFSSPLIWAPPALALVACLLCRRGRRSHALLVVLALALVIALCDQTTSSFMKPFFARLRPSHTPGVMQLLHYVGDYRGGLYGFASSHAANSFGVATYVSLFLRRRWTALALMALALCVGYSRIYLGVHYLGDVLAGALVGSLFGYLVYRMVPVAICRLRRMLLGLRSMGRGLWWMVRLAAGQSRIG